MKYVEFRKFTDENGAMPVYLFEGEEAYFREKGEKLLLDRFLADKTLDYADFDGATMKGEKLKTLVDALNCFPLLSEKRIVRVTEFYPSEKDFDFYLSDLFADPPPAGMLIVVNSAKGKAGTAALAKKSGVTFVDCGRADNETIKKWITVTMKRAGVFTDGVTAGKIAEYCVGNMSRVEKETEKLLAYCEGTGLNALTDEIVDEVVYPDTEYKLYELGDAVSRRNYTAFAKVLAELTNKGFDEIELLNSVGYHFRNLYEASLLRGSDKEAAAALGAKEFAIRKRREQAARFGKGEVLFCYERIYDAISRIKCGELTPSSALKTVTAQIFFGTN